MTLFQPSDHLARAYDEVIAWIYNHTLPNGGIMISNKDSRPYPEVTGYLIPALLNFGHFELAEQYCTWLMGVQNEDGSWNGSDGTPSFFDTGQVLRGLLAMIERRGYTGEPVQFEREAAGGGADMDALADWGGWTREDREPGGIPVGSGEVCA